MEPNSKQQIVERHVGFPPPHQVQEVTPVDPRYFRTETLVEPERLAGEAVKARHGSRGHNEGKRQPVRPARGEGLRSGSICAFFHSMGRHEAEIRSRSYYAVQALPGRVRDLNHGGHEVARRNDCLDFLRGASGPWW